MLYLGRFELYSRWMPLSYLHLICHIINLQMHNSLVTEQVM